MKQVKYDYSSYVLNEFIFSVWSLSLGTYSPFTPPSSIYKDKFSRTNVLTRLNIGPSLLRFPLCTCFSVVLINSSCSTFGREGNSCPRAMRWPTLDIWHWADEIVSNWMVAYTHSPGEEDTAVPCRATQRYPQEQSELPGAVGGRLCSASRCVQPASSGRMWMEVWIIPQAGSELKPTSQA